MRNSHRIADLEDCVQRLTTENADLKKQFDDYKANFAQFSNMSLQEIEAEKDALKIEVADLKRQLDEAQQQAQRQQQAQQLQAQQQQALQQQAQADAQKAPAHLPGISSPFAGFISSALLNAAASLGNAAAAAGGVTSDAGNLPGRLFAMANGQDSGAQTSGGGGDGGRGPLQMDVGNLGRGNAIDRRVNVRKTLCESGKLITIKMKHTNEIVEYIETQSLLGRAIDEFYREEEERLKIQIALVHLDDRLRLDSDYVYERMIEGGRFELEAFFMALFQMSFPSPMTTLQMGFAKLTQASPLKGSIPDYTRRMKTFCPMLKFELAPQIPRFIFGLEEAGVRAALRRHNLEQMSFEEVVGLSVTISNNLSVEKSTQMVMAGWEGEGSQDEEGMEVTGGDSVMKIFGVSLQKYFDMSDRKKITGRCFNCFGTSHTAERCTKKVCKFCLKGNREVRHYSLLCPRCPYDLTKFLEARNGAEEKRSKVLRLADDFVDYTFTDSDFEEGI